MDKVIVYNRLSDGGVSVCTPSPWCISMMSSGGMWSGEPRGYLDVLIERSIANGRDPDVSRRFVHAMHFGGLTTAEALAIIRDRDCAPFGTAMELWDSFDLPDRWFRNAWRRSHNGGPISIDLGMARPIQLRHIRSAVAEENERRSSSGNGGRGAFQIEIDIPSIERQLLAAKTLAEIRSIWPLGRSS